MKQQLSNEQAWLEQLIAVITSVAIPCLVIWVTRNTFSFGLVKWPFIIGGILFGLSRLYYSTRLYNVSFDNHFLYLSRIGKVKKISLEHVTDIRTGVIHRRFFGRNAYLITVSYFDDKKRNKLSFLSKGATGHIGTVDNIPMLEIFRKIMKEKKRIASQQANKEA